MKKTFLIFLSLAVWGMAGQAAEVKSKTDVNPQSAEAQTETGKEIEYNLGQAIEYMEQKDLDKALEYLNLHLQNNPASCEGYFLRTMINRNNERLNFALSDINNAIKYWKKILI